MNLALPEIGIAAISIGLLVTWVIGVMKLFQTNQRTLAWVAIVEILFPIIALRVSHSASS